MSENTSLRLYRRHSNISWYYHTETIPLWKEYIHLIVHIALNTASLSSIYVLELFQCSGKFVIFDCFAFIWAAYPWYYYKKHRWVLYTQIFVLDLLFKTICAKDSFKNVFESVVDLECRHEAWVNFNIWHNPLCEINKYV